MCQALPTLLYHLAAKLCMPEFCFQKLLCRSSEVLSDGQHECQDLQQSLSLILEQNVVHFIVNDASSLPITVKVIILFREECFGPDI